MFLILLGFCQILNNQNSFPAANPSAFRTNEAAMFLKEQPSSTVSAVKLSYAAVGYA
jgi:hypothetical protein